MGTAGGVKVADGHCKSFHLLPGLPRLRVMRRYCHSLRLCWVWMSSNIVSIGSMFVVVGQSLY